MRGVPRGVLARGDHLAALLPAAPRVGFIYRKAQAFSMGGDGSVRLLFIGFACEEIFVSRCSFHACALGVASGADPDFCAECGDGKKFNDICIP